MKRLKIKLKITCKLFLRASCNCFVIFCSSDALSSVQLFGPELFPTESKPTPRKIALPKEPSLGHEPCGPRECIGTIEMGELFPTFKVIIYNL